MIHTTHNAFLSKQMNNNTTLDSCFVLNKYILFIYIMQVPPSLYGENKFI